MTVGATPVTVDLATRRNYADADPALAEHASVAATNFRDETALGCGPAKMFDSDQGTAVDTTAPTDTDDPGTPEHEDAPRFITLKLARPVPAAEIWIDPTAHCGDLVGSSLGTYEITPTPTVTPAPTPTPVAGLRPSLAGTPRRLKVSARRKATVRVACLRAGSGTLPARCRVTLALSHGIARRTVTLRTGRAGSVALTVNRATFRALRRHAVSARLTAATGGRTVARAAKLHRWTKRGRPQWPPPVHVPSRNPRAPDVTVRRRCAGWTGSGAVTGRSRVRRCGARTVINLRAKAVNHHPPDVVIVIRGNYGS